MKKMLILSLCLALLMSLTACSEPAPKYEKPIQLYYRTAVTADEIAESVIGPVTVEGAALPEDPQALLNEYLKGTSAVGFLTTFPASTKLLSMELTEDTAILMLNPSITRLSGIDLTIACACITMTTMELTGVTTVRIRASNSSLDGADEIVMDRQTLILQDLYVPETT